MAVRTAQELLAYELETIEDAETKAAEALPDMAKAAESKELRNMVEQRMKQGEFVLDAVRKGLQKLDAGGERKSQNTAAQGLIRETERLMKEVDDPDMQHAVMIAGLQKLEHYCIAAWGTVKAMARQSGDEQLAKAMERAIKEGYQLDEKMTQMAEGQVNPAALKAG